MPIVREYRWEARHPRNRENGPICARIPNYASDWGAAARRNSDRCCGTATPPIMLVNQDGPNFPGVPPHPRIVRLRNPGSPTGVSSFQRRSPVTTISTARLPHREHTNRFRHSGTVVSGPYRCAISAGSGSA
jgi:hypothetical protein